MRIFLTPPGHRLGAGLPFFIDGSGRPHSAANAWLRHLRAENGATNSPHTLTAYTQALGRFLRFMEAGGVCWMRANDALLKDFRDRREAGGCRLPGIYGQRSAPRPPTQRTVHRDLLFVGQYYRWAAANGFLETCPITFRMGRIVHWAGRGGAARSTGVKLTPSEVPTAARKCPSRHSANHGRGPRGRKHATNEEVTRLLGAFRSWKYGLIARVMLESGMRRAEVAALEAETVSGVEIEEGQARLRSILGKGDKRRDVYITVGLQRELRDFISRRPGGPARFVFCTVRGDPLRPASINRTFARASRRAGLKHNLRPHALRHTFAYRFLQDFAASGIHNGLMLLSELLGHERLETTRRHYGRMGDGLMAAARVAAKARRGPSPGVPSTHPGTAR